MRTPISAALKKVAPLVWMLPLMAASISSAWGFSVNLDPPSAILSIKPGESTTQTVTLTNTGVEEVSVHVYAEDWTYAPDGGKKFSPPGTTERSCANGMTLTPRELTLKPGERGAVQVTVTLPPEATGGYQAVAFFESMLGTGPGQAQGSQVMFAGRLGTLIFVEAQGAVHRHGAVTKVSATPPTASRPLEVEFLFGNDGDTHLFADGALSILNSKGEYVGREKIERFGALPGTARRRRTPWAGELPVGTYSVIVTLDYGGADPAVSETTLVVPVKELEVPKRTQKRG